MSPPPARPTPDALRREAMERAEAGDLDAAAAGLAAAVAARDRRGEAAAPAQAEDLDHLAALLRALGRDAEAEAAMRRLLAHPHAPTGEPRGQLLLAHGLMLEALDRHADAAVAAAAAAELLPRDPGPGSLGQGQALVVTGRALLGLGRLAEAEGALRAGLGIMEDAGEPPDAIAAILLMLGIVALRDERPAAAAALFRRVAEIARAGEGAGSGPHADALLMLGRALRRADRPEEALAPLGEALAAQEGPEGDPARIATLHCELGCARTLLGEEEAALAHYLEATARAEAVHGPDDADTRLARDQAAACLERLGRWEAAVPLRAHALASLRAEHGSAHGALVAPMTELAGTLALAGRPEEAEPLYREAETIAAAAFGRRDPAYWETVNNLGFFLGNAGRLAEAEALHRAALAARERDPGPLAAACLDSVLNLAWTLAAAGRAGEGDAVFDRHLALVTAAAEADPEAIETPAETMAAFARFHSALRPAEAETWFARALAAAAAALGPEDPATRALADEAAAHRRAARRH